MMTLRFGTRGGGLRFEIKCEDEDAEWLRALFTRNAHPFAALEEIGFVPRWMNFDSDRAPAQKEPADG